MLGPWLLLSESGFSWDGYRTHALSFLTQQQDDLGAAFQTWMDAQGAVRSEVLVGSLLT